MRGKEVTQEQLETIVRCARQLKMQAHRAVSPEGECVKLRSTVGDVSSEVALIGVDPTPGLFPTFVVRWLGRTTGQVGRVTNHTSAEEAVIAVAQELSLREATWRLGGLK